MKLSFSTNRWKGYSFDKFSSIAKEMKFKGIELHDIKSDLFTGKNAPFNKDLANATMRDLFEKKLEIPCIDTTCNPANSSKHNENISEIVKAIEIASSLKIPYLRIRAIEVGSYEESFKAVSNCIEKVINLLEKKNMSILVETVGMFADTSKLADLLNTFASDNVSCLWDIYGTYFLNNESPETPIKNLGAHIKHVHIKDAVRNGENLTYCLMGEGQLPVSEVIFALQSINYDGFISLEWDPKWFEELDDMDIIFAQFVSYMNGFNDPSKAKSQLYSNKAATGKYVWKKDLLIKETFSGVLDRMVEEFPDQYAFKYTTLDYTRTYSEFRDDVDAFARSLLALGVKKGHHIAVWATNIPEWFIAFWAVTKIGCVLVSMNTAYKIHEAEYLLKQSDTNTLVMVNGYRDSNYEEIISELCPELETKSPNSPLRSKRLPFLRNVITVGFKHKGCVTFEEAMALSDTVSQEEVDKIAKSVDSRSVCNMQYTSGTTGFPKGVMLTHHNVVNNGKCIGDRMDLSTADRMMIQVPMFHCFGMVLAMTAAMTHGATLFPLPYFSPKPALACINHERITALHGVPTMFIALLEHKDFAKTDFSYMRTGIMAGSLCPIKVMQQVVNQMNMKDITIVYGQTESSPGCTMSSTDDSLEVRVETVGSPLPEIECKIINPETNKECKVGETGEFVARGYNIMKGYYKMPRETTSTIDKDGWLHTGDLACKTPEGNFKITGRLKDMIIRGGENIYPKEIEEFIYTNEKVKDVQVIGVPDEQYGEEIMACIILKEKGSMTEAEMKSYINDHMARHKVPRYIDFVDSFPMNVAGKILKYKMREDAIEKLGLKK